MQQERSRFRSRLVPGNRTDVIGSPDRKICAFEIPRLSSRGWPTWHLASTVLSKQILRAHPSLSQCPIHRRSPQRSSMGGRCNPHRGDEKLIKQTDAPRLFPSSYRLPPLTPQAIVLVRLGYKCIPSYPSPTHASTGPVSAAATRREEKVSTTIQLPLVERV